MARFQISAADHGKPVTLRVGDELVIKLPENPTTGYRWQLDPSGGSFLALRNDQFDLPQHAAMGAGGTRVLTLQAVSAGLECLHLELRRPWEQGQPALQDFSVSADIRSD